MQPTEKLTLVSPFNEVNKYSFYQSERFTHPLLKVFKQKLKTWSKLFPENRIIFGQPLKLACSGENPSLPHNGCVNFSIIGIRTEIATNYVQAFIKLHFSFLEVVHFVSPLFFPTSNNLSFYFLPINYGKVRVA